MYILLDFTGSVGFCKKIENLNTQRRLSEILFLNYKTRAQICPIKNESKGKMNGRTLSYIRSYILEVLYRSFTYLLRYKKEALRISRLDNILVEN